MKKRFLKFFLKIFTILLIRKYKPKIVAITGSVGKTSTKEGVYDAFSDIKRVRKSFGNLNTEIGAPLVFFKEIKSGKTIKEWISIFLKGILLLTIRDKDYPEIIVVELGADKPGDISYLTTFIKPDIAIVTAVGEIPVHLEHYKNTYEVAREKGKIVSALKNNGVAVLNFDDHHYTDLKDDKKEEISFGFKKGASVFIKNFKTNSLKGSDIEIIYKGESYKMFLSGCIGFSFAYVAASIFSIGIALQISPERLPKLIEKIRPTKGRLYVLKGINGSILLDGSYNAAPASMESALKTLKELQAERKIVVMGDMLELGEVSLREHQKISQLAISFCDYIFAVGNFSGIIRESAIKGGFKKEKIYSFSKAEDALEEIRKTISPGDLILVKGSQGVRLEKIAYNIMRDKERSEELLVRQTEEWKKK